MTLLHPFETFWTQIRAFLKLLNAPDTSTQSVLTDRQLRKIMTGEDSDIPAIRWGGKLIFPRTEDEFHRIVQRHTQLRAYMDIAWTTVMTILFTLLLIELYGILRSFVQP